MLLPNIRMPKLIIAFASTKAFARCLSSWRRLVCGGEGAVLHSRCRRPGLRDTAVTVLEAAGYLVVAAGSGEAALALLSAQPEPHLLFTDVVLGSGLNGFELAQRAVCLPPRLKILYATGYAWILSEQHEAASRQPDAAETLSRSARRRCAARAAGTADWATGSRSRGCCGAPAARSAAGRPRRRG
jgi:CheY-like chemotaxis protein